MWRFIELKTESGSSQAPPALNFSLMIRLCVLARSDITTYGEFSLQKKHDAISVWRPYDPIHKVAAGNGQEDRKEKKPDSCAKSCSAIPPFLNSLLFSFTAATCQETSVLKS